MTIKKRLKTRLVKAILGIFLVFMGLFGATAGTVLNSQSAYAIPEETETETTQVVTSGDSCKDSLGAIGWFVCPTTGKIAEAVDWLYDKIEDILVINPISTEDGSPIYGLWKYCRGLTNIVFIIFLLVVIYSQITGLGISNYGVKRALPKLIIAAILVNLSFIVCSLAVDLSNVIGNGLRGVFATIAESAVVGGTSGVTAAGDLTREVKVSYAGMYSSLAGGAALAVGAGVIAFDAGAIWMLIPTLLGAIVAVVTGLITIALRQAVVVLLIMVSPLAMVAYILPNTEDLFKKWKNLLIRMLVFYPVFSLLFGASQLAGFAIIASAKDGFGLILGMAVQIFPLFFSWKLMQMSGTFLGNINTRLRGLAATPLASTRAWADSRRQLSRQRNLTSERVYTPSLKLMQFMSDRRVAREADIEEYTKEAKERGLAYRARKNYKDGNIYGTLSKHGEEAYERQARVMEYQRVSLRDKNNFNKGFGYTAKKGTDLRRRLDALDMRNVNAADTLFAEQTRGEKIDYENAEGRHKRMEAAINAHFDEVNGHKMDYAVHDIENRAEAISRYNALHQIMDGQLVDANVSAMDVQFAAAGAALSYDTQMKMLATKYQKYFELTPPTRDVEFRLGELTKLSSAELASGKKAANYIDAIIPGLRILNQRGDTDLVKEHIDNILDKKLGGGVELGTHASQALASFLMFEVKDNDPWLRRFGKYINLETANTFNRNNRRAREITYDEYIKGFHTEPNGEIMYAKRPMAILMEGTSLDNVERTAFGNFDESLIKAYTYVGEDGEKHLDIEKYLDKREEIQKAIGPQFISASLKYLSGSEQLKNAVSFLTGYTYSQAKDENGKVMVDDKGNVLYEWKARWDDRKGDFVDNPRVAEKYFRKRSLKYFEEQTPTQILGLRSDYFEPLKEHLVQAYLEDPEEGAAYRAKIDEIQSRYGDLSPREAQKNRERDLKKIKMEMAGKQVRKILGKSGKLEQIYRTRRSGAANNAKDWLREWVGLDDEEMLFREVNRYKREREGLERVDDAGGAEVDDSTRIYNNAKRKEIRDSLEKLWEDNKDVSAGEFYDVAIEAIRSWLGGETLIEKAFKASYERKNGNESLEAYELKKDLEDLLMDPNNYPDA